VLGMRWRVGGVVVVVGLVGRILRLRRGEIRLERGY
jgi:hypothetical protein